MQPTLKEAITQGSAQAPPLGRYYAIGGRQLLLHRSGSGSPAVVFLPGGGAVGLDYLNVQARAAELTTSVLYDRAGTGWSDRAELPRTSAEVTDELRKLLRTVGVPGPYILVGHSLGGLYARHYAQRFPDDVAGLLLLDPAHEDYDAYMPNELTKLRQSNKTFAILNAVMAVMLRTGITKAALRRVPTVRRYQALYRALFEEAMGDWPNDIREQLIERHVSLEWLGIGVREAANVQELYEEIRRAGPMPDIPMIVLCSMGIDGFRQALLMGESESLLQQEIDGKRRLYEALAASVPRGEVRLLDAGHVTLHMRHPDAVVQAIQDLLARNHAS